MYIKYFKRILDLILSLLALIVFSPLMLILTIIGAIKMNGNPFFIQPRPGRNERIINLIKFKSMTDERDESGNLLSDELRLIPYGKWLRSTSLDELPSLCCIIKGDLAIVGPRPLLMIDMVFMTPEQRKRHFVRQGLTGLAQCNGRNNMTWEQKFEYDLQYIQNITLLGDLRIIVKTVSTVFKRDGITEQGMVTAEDLGDYLLHKGSVKYEEYCRKHDEAKELMEA